MSGKKLLLALVPLAFHASACGKLREVSACRAIVREVNPALDEIEQLAKQKPVNEARIANRYAALAKALGPRAVGDTALASSVRDYVSVVQATAAAVRADEAAGKAQPARVIEARRELERLLKRERAAASRLEAECHN
jgi:hypothetical protein